MEESILVNKAEDYLSEISKDIINLDDIDELENFKNLYFKLDDRLKHLQKLKNDMDAKGYTTPFTSLNKYGTRAVAEVSLEEMAEAGRHNQMFRMKANAKKNVLDRVKSAIDSHKIALANLREFGYLKCNSCYKRYGIEDYKASDGRCKCGNNSFSFKVDKEKTYRLEIIPYLPLSGNYMVATSELSAYGRNSFKNILNILKQERTGTVKTISLVIKYKDSNNRWIRKNVNLDSEYVDNYEEELRKQYGANVRIEVLRFYRTKPAIIDDKHARTALAIAYAKYCEDIVQEIKDDIFKRQISDFKRINKYDEVMQKYKNSVPDFIDDFDVNGIERWRSEERQRELRNLHYMDKFGNLTRSLKRDLKTRETIERSIFENIAPALISWDIFKYYLTTSYNSRRMNNGPFPYIRVELDRQQRKIFQTTFEKVINILNSFSALKITPIEDKDLILYEKFKFEKQIKNSNIKFNPTALGAALIHLNSDIEIETISNAFNINESKIKKEIKNINHIKNPKTEKSKKFLDLIKK